MSKLSISENWKYILIVPFVYALVSRYDWPRGFLVNAVTAWIPGVILVAWQSEIFSLHSISAYILGYLCFICLYEIGYMINDSFGLKYDATPRARVDIEFNRLFISLFISIRLVTFSVIFLLNDLAFNLQFWTASLALVFVLILHNAIRKVEFKLVTFLQLSLMRFALPILFALLILNEPENSTMIFIIGLLLFTYPRFLTYLEAKGRLVLTERRNVSFLLLSHLIALPLLLFVAAIEKSGAPVVAWVWFSIVQTIYFMIGYVYFFIRLKSLLGLKKVQGSD